MAGKVPRALNKGRYTITDTLGAGGMATVSRCYDHRLHVWRAAKFLRPELASKPAARRRFDLEARAMARIEHRHVLRVYDVGEEAGLPFMVMEFAPGGSLENYLEIHKQMGPSLACHAIRQVCDGVSAAHEMGVIHRDLKPDNVLVSARGRCKVTDFGIAQVLDGNSHTRTGSVMGTLAYMAPEQRKDAKHITPAVDVYALGATLYTLITGTVPTDLFLAVHDKSLLDVLPEPIRPIVRRCVSIEPEQRYQSTSQLAHALEKVQPILEGGVTHLALITRTIASTDPPEPTLPAEDIATKGPSTDPTYFPADDNATPNVLPYFMPEQEAKNDTAPEYIHAEHDDRKAKALARIASLKKMGSVTMEPAPPRSSDSELHPQDTTSSATPKPTEGQNNPGSAPDVVEAVQEKVVWAFITTLEFILNPLKPMLIPLAMLAVVMVMALGVGSYKVGNARSAALASEKQLYATIEAEAKVLKDLEAYNAPEELPAAHLQTMRRLSPGPDRLEAAQRYITSVEENVERYAPSAPTSMQHKVTMSYTRLDRLKASRQAHTDMLLRWEQVADTSLGRFACSTAFATCPQ